jgi:hypothetical protein
MAGGGSKPNRAFGVEQESGTRKGDPIRNAGVRFMQAFDPLVVRQNIQNWPMSKPEYQKRQHAAEQARNKRVFAKMIKAKPYSGCGRELCVTAADPAMRKQSESDGQNQSPALEMPGDVRCGEAACDGQGDE